MQTLSKLEKKLNRQQAMEQGAYDGRFRPRIVKDKKKEQARNWARGGKYA